jgi:hypothetical protein
MYTTKKKRIIFCTSGRAHVRENDSGDESKKATIRERLFFVILDALRFSVFLHLILVDQGWFFKKLVS